MTSSGNFPLVRLATLLARQLSAPVATKIKTRARTHPRFGRLVCMRTGRAYHEYQLRLKMWSMALRQPRHLAPISDQTALDCGANLLGEMVVFGMGALCVTLEVNRQANKQEDKVLAEESQWMALLVSLEELQHEVVLQQQDIDRLQAMLHRIVLHNNEPTTSAPALPPISDFDGLSPPDAISPSPPPPATHP